MTNETLSKVAYKELKKQILAGVYKPGERLLLDTVSKALNISMTPLKDAFSKLEYDGLVETIPRKGAFVTKLSKTDFQDFIEIRIALETFAIELFYKKGNHNIVGIQELEEINRNVAKTIEDEDKTGFILADMEFHQKMVSLAGNSRLTDMFSRFPLSNFIVLMGNEMTKEEGRKVISQHEAIIQSLKNMNNLEETKQYVLDNITGLHEKLNFDFQ